MDNNPPFDARAQFPSHNEPRVWLITAGDSPIGLSVARQVLAHGDYAFLGLAHSALERDERRRGEFDAFLVEVEHHGDGWAQRIKTVPLDIRMMGQCQAVVADAVATFGRVDILLCSLIGTVEELSASTQTMNLVRDQFEVNYFGPLNIIKATLPHMRKERAGHVMIISGITAHIGTPGLGMYCAAGWALEGFCDSLAYEIAPFNVKLTILQCSIEIGILTNLVTSVPPIFPAYSPANNQAPLFRGILNHLIPQLPDASISSDSPVTPSRATDENARVSSIENGPFSAPEVVSMHPPLSSAHLEVLVSETVYAITSIAGHENPPSRHIVGQEGVASVKEKLKTVSEELEDFIQASFAVDVAADSDPMPALSGTNDGP
ncbi:Short-chain dehydrogenase/reductase SDR [Penicillium expansum]|uniref:Short-chain dehydrogenase/reductase SDR n=1 Tax=Penicillium expansum TaxID=27334 RepID=A0A0A2J1I0_PENEN|nr:Short-chain dehydrogenase/reductase SDR [Penicillium expansum]KGO49197.1 Short-chain dehydrogenase/reductase SDR [Penicillium expansum]KGO50738.1 Short-chain dehydrogenase/reductase SDR [Penicillium expansum]KGO54128.1 Short-chain dehydrogenase/reductase SDR [Penicillium expansum]